jgi:hypothetical protein
MGHSDGSLVWSLPWPSERDGLDCKREQYEFDRPGTRDDERSEGVNDILAMVNAWVFDEAVIAVGFGLRGEER